jgi:hypothetical protein
MISGFAADMLLLSAANIDAEETINVPGPIVLLLPLTLAGCISFSSSSPSPPAKNTTIVVPPDSTITIDPGRLCLSRSLGYLSEEMVACLSVFGSSWSDSGLLLISRCSQGWR